MKLSRNRPQVKGIDRLSLVEPAKDGAWVKLIPMTDKNDVPRWGIEFVVRYDHPDAHLVLPEEGMKGNAPSDAQGVHRIRVPLEGQSSRFKLTAILPTGQTEIEEFQTSFPDWEKVPKLAVSKGFFAGLQKTASLGYSSLKYHETGIQPIEASALTLKGGVSGGFGKGSPWSWGLMAYGTALPLSVDRSETNFRFLGINARVGYLVPWPRSPWSLRVMTGFYYTTMMVSAPTEAQAFGFQNQFGPQIFPLLSRGLGGGRLVSGYLKMASIAYGLDIFDTTSRELGWGISYSHPMARGVSLSVALDQAWLQTQIEESLLKSDSLSFSAGVTISDR